MDFEPDEAFYTVSFSKALGHFFTMLPDPAQQV